MGDCRTVTVSVMALLYPPSADAGREERLRLPPYGPDTHIVLDFSGLYALDAIQTARVQSECIKVARAGGTFAFTNLNDWVRRVFRVLKFGAWADLDLDPDAALLAGSMEITKERARNLARQQEAREEERREPPKQPKRGPEGRRVWTPGAKMRKGNPG